ncbi:MAG: hypothetical protein ABI671_21060 [Burkholderiales bacterium]
MKRSKFVLAIAAAVALSTNAMADNQSSGPTIDASSLKLQVYSVMLSTSPLCTNPYTVFSSASPTEVDFLSAPTLGSGNPPDATYHCVIIKLSDIIKFKPSSTSGLCTAGTEYVADVCRSDNNGSTQAPGSSTQTACTGTDAAPHSDAVYMYLTTNALAGTGGEVFLQPTDVNSSYGLHLTAPLVIAGKAKSKFIVDATGKVGSDSVSCGMNPPVFGFQKVQ